MAPPPLPDPFPVHPVTGPLDATVVVPGSKSITNRALVCAALANGVSVLEGALFAADTEAMSGVLQTLGITVAADDQAHGVAVTGRAGAIAATDDPLYVAQSGTTSRFTAALTLVGRGTYHLTAHDQMSLRPMGPTFDALRQLGATVAADDDRLPAHITLPEGLATGAVAVPGDASSQFLSGLLLVAPCLPGGLTIAVTTPLVSQPYVEVTLAVMEAFGASVARPDPSTFMVAPTGYRARTYRVEPDASAASYPLAAAAICGGRVTVQGLGADALQGDAAFAEVLGTMGAEVTRTTSATTVDCRGVELRGGTFDFTHISDTAQTIAVVAPHAAAPVTITGIGFIRGKEIDRLSAVVTELRRCGIEVEAHDDGWTIHPGAPRPTVVQTYDDHRMAMSFALLGLANPGIEIADPSCVAKTFPGYWDMLDGLQGSGASR